MPGVFLPAGVHLHTVKKRSGDANPGGHHHQDQVSFAAFHEGNLLRVNGLTACKGGTVVKPESDKKNSLVSHQHYLKNMYYSKFVLTRQLFRLPASSLDVRLVIYYLNVYFLL